MANEWIEIEYGMWIIHPQNPDIVIFESGNQYLFIYGFTNDTHVVKIDVMSEIPFPTDNDMTMGQACIYETNFKDIYHWEF
jgi:ribosomal protein L31